MSMRAVQYTNGCTPEGLVIGSVDVPVLRHGEIMVDVWASAVNRADISQRLGKYDPPPGASKVLGLEAAGVVSGNGYGWKEGDRVMALLPGGGYAEKVTVNAQHLLPIPKKLSVQEAAAIPEAWLTAFQLLFFVANIQPGEWVLVHAGASGVGTAAIQLIKKVFKGHAIAVAGSQEKLNFLKTLEADCVINYKEGPFSQKVLDCTSGRGVNIVMDCVGGSNVEENTKSIAVDGRWVLFGLMGGLTASDSLLPTILRKRIRMEGSTLRSRSDEYKSNLVSEFKSKALPLFESGELKPIIDSMYPLERAGDAHAHVEANRNIGKVILTVSNNEKSEL